MKWNIRIILMVLITTTVSQDIQILPYSQNDSLTKCTNGLLAGEDIIVFKSLLDFSDDLDLSTVYFQTRKESNYRHLCLVNIKENCNLNRKKCACRKSNEHILEITIRLNASVSYSGAWLRGVAIRSSDNLQKYGQEQMFPNIYDRNRTTGHVFINGKQQDTIRNHCEEYISGPDLNFTFVCIGELSPCLIMISANDSTEDIQGRELASFYSVYNKSQEINVNVKYAACSLEGFYHAVSCKINIARVDNFRCHNEISTDKIILKCSAIVFSNMNCKYFINKHDIRDVLPNVKVTPNMERIQWTPSAQTANCGFNLLKTDVRPGLYDVVVVMQPSVDTYDDDIKLGTNANISIPIMTFEDISCVNDSTDDVVNVSCNVARIYPQAKCRVVIIGKNEKIIIPETNITLVNELVQSNATYYTSQCVFTANTMTFNPGHYELVVTLYTGIENDLRFADPWSVFLHIRDSIEYTYDARSTEVIAYIAGGNTLIILIFVVIGYYKLKDSRWTCDSCLPCVTSKIVPGNYDVINQGYILVDAGIYRDNNEYDTSGYILIESSNPNENTQQIESDQHNIYETIDEDVLTSRVVFLSNIQHVKMDINKVDTDIDTRNGDTSNSDCNSSSSTSRHCQLGSQD
ncbi:unnamed protein product [Lymnaea stagnalis]|uniref:Uncharacterized protein n=1 Tax=Lymnaea stagnalis TaxID=6523 RepID=A0AAV2HFZ4_LYMST